jgi:DNA-binding beta-propeller fold protein YncE
LSGRYALIVANELYEDATLRKLRAPARDAAALSRVLGDPLIGGFDTDVFANEPEHLLRRRLHAFFDGRAPDDLLLLHISCHGLKDVDGELYFAARDTDVARLDATAVPAEYVVRQMNRTRCRQVVVLLDCCYSGAISRVLRFRGGRDVAAPERLVGRGRAVITASSAMEYAFEGDDVSEIGDERPSVFTSAVVTGLETGDADRDGDQRISVSELYDYVSEHVRRATPHQRPGMLSQLEGELYIARAPARAPAEAASGEAVPPAPAGALGGPAATSGGAIGSRKPGAGALSWVFRRRPAHARRAAALAISALLVLVAGAVVFERDLVSNTPSGELSLKTTPVGCFSDDSTGGACALGPALDRAHSVAVSQDGRNVYVASDDSGAVVVFERDRDTGALALKGDRRDCLSFDRENTACTTVRALAAAEGVEVSPDGQNVYAVSEDDDAVVVFDRDRSNGTLRQKQGTEGCISEDGSSGCADGTALEGAGALAISENGRSVYVASYGSNAVAVFDRDARSGALTQKAGRTGCASESGTGGACTNAKALLEPQAVTVSPDGHSVYVLSDASNAVAVFDRDPGGGLELKRGLAGCISDDGTPYDGASRCVDGAGLQVDDGSNAVVVSPDGGNVYVASHTSGAVVVLDRDTSTGALSQDRVHGCFSYDGSDGCEVTPSLNGAAAVAISRDGRNVYVGSYVSDAVVTFDRNIHTGVLKRKPGPTGCAAVDRTADDCATASALGGVSSVAVSPDGKNVYVTSKDADALSIFDRR